MTLGHAIISFVILAGTLSLIPGLDMTLVLRHALASGTRQGLAAGAGVVLGLFVWGAAAALGAVALLAASHTAFLVVKFAGVAYMAGLGINLIVRSFRGERALEAAEAELSAPGRPASAGAAFMQGVGTNMLNPKVAVFYMATLPQFMPEGVSHLVMGLGLAALHGVICMVVFALLVAVAARARAFLSTPRAQRWIDRVAGTLMVAFAGKLAFQRA